MSERGTRWARQQDAEVARMYHDDGTPRWSLLRTFRRAFREFGWPRHTTAAQRRLEQRARALDAVADDPVAYERLLWADPLLPREAPDNEVMNGRGRRAQCCDADHGCTGFVTDGRDRNQRYQAALDSIRTGAKRRARAMDTGALAKPDFGVKPWNLPYFRSAGGRATDAHEGSIFDLQAVERTASAMYGRWVGR